MHKIAMSLATILLCVQGSATIIKKPPSKPVDLPYTELPCSEADKKIIFEIITMISDNNWLDLLLKRAEIYKLGSHIDHVHPMKFVTTILNNPELKSSLQKLWPDPLKRAGFLEGLVPKMNREAERNRLNQHIENFATELRVSPAELKPFFESRDWEEMVQHLIRS